MTEIAISLKNVSKCFKRYARPVDRLKEILLPGKSRADEFWALQDINLEVYKGETVGIVGRNGSGKSTLLQIIAGTLTPTTGEVQVKGRVSALLELGSGFNPEFTGRQNVFFNGRLLGLSTKEIEEKFDEIISFAEIGDFIDQPVKTYSSGMFVRLAFAVAVHVEPDILIIDEALAVGDIFFQAKCFRSLEVLRSKGISILFVSHDTNSVQNLCSKGILLQDGIVICEDVASVITSEYYKLFRTEYEDINEIKNKQSNIFPESRENLCLINLAEKHRLSNGQATIQQVFASSLNGAPQAEFFVEDSINVTALIEFHSICYNVTVGFGLRDKYGKLIGGKHSWYDAPGPLPIVYEGEIIEFVFSLQLTVQVGEYLAILGTGANKTESDYESLDIIQDAFIIKVIGNNKTWGIASLPGTVQINRKTLAIPINSPI